MPRPGRLGRVTREWAEGVREKSGDDRPRLILVELAVDAADMADRARTAREDRIYLAAASRLQQLIMVADRDSNTGTGGIDWDAAMGQLMGAGAEVGDAT